MRIVGRVVPVAAGGIAGFVIGAVLTMAVQSAGRPVPGEGTDVLSTQAPAPATVPEPPATFLAWTAGGLPSTFGSRAASLGSIKRVVVVASDNTWMTRSVSADGRVVDDPQGPFAIPLEVAAVDPFAYAPFLPPADRGVVVDLDDGRGVLGESSAKLRRLGPGAVLHFAGVEVEIAAILPDELLGAHELLVSRDVGSKLGVTHDRYALIQPNGEPQEQRIRNDVRSIIPPGVPLQVRAPGETPYFRHGDAVLPPVQIKLLFGEFAARPEPGRYGWLDVDRGWLREHIDTRLVPLLGRVTCNVALFPQLRGAIHQLIEEGLADTIDSYSGCFAARYLNRDPSAGISHHSWGIAVDINAPQNVFGATPTQDERMVEIFEQWGFIWGGRFITPDGMHFEYRRPPSD
jgi:D-alanyl-D-alanine carboxypeptidase